MPPAAGGAAPTVGSVPACADSLLHWPAALTRSAAVTGRNVKSCLPPENVAQSGLRSNVSGLGRVTLLRLRSDEHAATTQPSVAMAIIRNTIWFSRCIATAPSRLIAVAPAAAWRGPRLPRQPRGIENTSPERPADLLSARFVQ